MGGSGWVQKLKNLLLARHGKLAYGKTELNFIVQELWLVEDIDICIISPSI